MQGCRLCSGGKWRAANGNVTKLLQDFDAPYIMDPGQGRSLVELTKEQDPPVSGHKMLKVHFYS